MLKQTMPPPRKDTFVWISGVKAMDKMVGEQLGELGYPGERKFAIRGKFYLSLVISTFFSFLKRIFTCQCCRQKNE